MVCGSAGVWDMARGGPGFVSFRSVSLGPEEFDVLLCCAGKANDPVSDKVVQMENPACPPCIVLYFYCFVKLGGAS